MNLQNLLDPTGTGAACFYAQFIQAIIPDAASLPLGFASPIANLVNSHIKPITGGADCPVVDKFDQSLFNQFPGCKLFALHTLNCDHDS